MQVCKKFIPIIDKEHGRIVTIGSAIGHLATFENEEIRNQLGNPELTIEELSALMDKYKVCYPHFLSLSLSSNAPLSVSWCCCLSN